MVKELERLQSFRTNSILTDPPSYQNQGNITIFIDGSHLFYAASLLDLKINYLRLLNYLTKGAKSFKAFFYTGFDPNDSKQKYFCHKLNNNGYLVITKDLTQLTRKPGKSLLTLEIAVDLIKLVPYYETAIVLSGDGNLTKAIDTVTYRGARVELVSLRTMTSEKLMNIADSYTDLATIKKVIERF
ncbi:MAG: NYN domain-containing protein [Prochloraceae cyanobacterium]